MAQITKHSKAWYLLPLFLGIIGGIIAYFILRNSDYSKAKYCLIIGVGITLIGIVLSLVLVSDKDSETKPSISLHNEILEPSKKPTLSNKDIQDIVLSYKGEDKKGDSILDVIHYFVGLAYINENVFDHPNDILSYNIIKDSNQGESVRKITIHIDTYREDATVEFYYNTLNEMIWTDDELGNTILEIVNSYDDNGFNYNTILETKTDVIQDISKPSYSYYCDELEKWNNQYPDGWLTVETKKEYQKYCT